MTIIAKNLDQAGVTLAQSVATNIANSAILGIGPNEFVWLGCFDGTNNDKNNPGLSGDPYTTNVGALFDQFIKQDSNQTARYFAGPGTDGPLDSSSWLAPVTTLKVKEIAERAYQQFNNDAAAWISNHPGCDVSTAITGFSRGCIVASVFSQLVYERGVTDPSTKHVLVPPGDVRLSAGVLFDPVGTGVAGNVTLGPNANNIVVIRAEDEYRDSFKATNIGAENGVKTFWMIGNHCDIGGGYDRGIGSLTLEAATEFFQRSGLSIGTVAASRRFIASEAAIHDEGFRIEGYNEVRYWATYNSVREGEQTSVPRQFDNHATPPIDEYWNDGQEHVFTDIYGNGIDGQIYVDREGIRNEMRITDGNGYYQDRIYLRLNDGTYMETDHSWTDVNGRYSEYQRVNGSHGWSRYLNDNTSHVESYEADNSSYIWDFSLDQITVMKVRNSDGSSLETTDYPDGTHLQNNTYSDGGYSVSNRYANGSEHLESHNADGSYSVNSSNADGSYRTEYGRIDGSYYLDYRKPDHSGETISTSPYSSYHATWTASGSMTAEMESDAGHGTMSDDGHGNTKFDFCGVDGTEQHNSQNSDHSSVSEVVNSDKSVDRHAVMADGTVVDIHQNEDGSARQNTFKFNDEINKGSIETIDIHADGSMIRNLMEGEGRGGQNSLEKITHSIHESFDVNGTLTSSHEYSDLTLDSGLEHHKTIDFNGYVTYTEDVKDNSDGTIDTVSDFLSADGARHYYGTEHSYDPNKNHYVADTQGVCYDGYLTQHDEMDNGILTIHLEISHEGRQTDFADYVYWNGVLHASHQVRYDRDGKSYTEVAVTGYDDGSYSSELIEVYGSNTIHHSHSNGITNLLTY